MRSDVQYGKAGVVAALCLTMVLAGCSTAWIGDAEKIVAALIPAAENTLALVAALQGKGVSAADVSSIQNAGTQAAADLQLVQALTTAYQKADEDARPGILNQIQAGIEATQASLQGLLPAMHIRDAVMQAKITAVLGIVLAEVQSLAAIVPVVKGIPEQNARQNGAARAVNVRQPLTADQFVSSFNATLTAKTGNAELDRRTAGLKIHAHGKLARWASVGMLK